LLSLLLRFYDPQQSRSSTAATCAFQYRRCAANRRRAARAGIVLDDGRRQHCLWSTGRNAPIEEAARQAGAHDFITAMTQGYADARIGERGVMLSGGQRQRLALARAFLKNSPILILDEPTAALDAETEAAVLRALERLRQRRTVFVVAHRLSTVRDATMLLVLHDGQIVERGTHAELVAKGGHYARVVHLQLGS
jgi:subfamily B ATP-binding cassette protein MsbA